MFKIACHIYDIELESEKSNGTSTRIIPTFPGLHVFDTHMRSSRDTDSGHYDLIAYHLNDLIINLQVCDINTTNIILNKLNFNEVKIRNSESGSQEAANL